MSPAGFAFPLRPARLLAWALVGSLLGGPRPGVAGEEARPTPGYPPTRTVDAADVMHGVPVADPYRWLEPDDDPEVKAWDEAQHAVLRRVLDAVPGRAEDQARLAAEFALGGMPSLPRHEGGRRWHTFRASGQEHAVLYATDPGGEPRVVLDPNAWSTEATDRLLRWAPSPDGRYLAYARDEKGSEEAVIHVLDLAQGQELPERIPRAKFSFLAWSDDSLGFFYTPLPDPALVPEGEQEHHRRVRYHRLGTGVLDDPPVYGAGRELLEFPWMYRSSDQRHLFLARTLKDESVETFAATWDGERLGLTPLVLGARDQTYVDRAGDFFVVSSNHLEPNRRVYLAERQPDGTAGPWQPVDLGLAPDAVVQDAWVVGDRFLLVHARQDVVSELVVVRLHEAGAARIPLPGPGTVQDVAVRPGSSEVRFAFESYSVPPTHYRADLATPGAEPEAVLRLPTRVAVDDLVSERLAFASRDGTRIPAFVLRRRDTPLDGSAPTVLYGYGGFRVGLYPAFSRARGLWVEGGGVWVVACLRGGDEFGERWHEQGSRAHKQNCFDDLIAVADGLVTSGRARRERLAIQGGSNGGLLVAAVVNQRPDLCRAAICGVPLTDMLRFHRFKYARSWTREYGDPDQAEEFAWIRPYSPYHNAPEGVCYPAVLLTAGLFDGRVNAFHARKMAARWQAAAAGGGPILLRIDRKGGHGAANLTRAIDELVDEWAFLRLTIGR